MSENDWCNEIAMEIMVSTRDGKIVEMNKAAQTVFKPDGGLNLLGKDILECHPQPARQKLLNMMDTQNTNAFLDTENGIKRFYFQSPWYLSGEYSGFIELSFEVGGEIPHYKRD